MIAVCAALVTWLPAEAQFLGPAIEANVELTQQDLDIIHHTVSDQVHGKPTDTNHDAVTIVTGRNLLGDPDAGFVLAIGSFSYKFDAAGNLVQPLMGTGQLIKVCPLIS